VAVLVGRACYVTPADAATAFYSGVVPVVSTNGRITELSFSGGVWNVVTSGSSGVISSFPAPVPELADCNLAGRMADNGALAALVLLVWVSAWGVGMLRRALTV